MNFLLVAGTLAAAAAAAAVVILGRKKKPQRVSVAVQEESTPPTGTPKTNSSARDPAGQVGHLPRRSLLSTQNLVCEPSTGPNVQAVRTLHDSFRRGVAKFGDRDFCGERKLIKLHSTVKVINDQKKTWYHYENSPFKYYSYKEVEKRVDNVAAGLRKAGLEPTQWCGLYMETCMDWLVTEQACYSQSIAVLTVYSNLGEEALCFALNQAELKLLVCGGESLKMLAKVSDEIKGIKTIIYSGDADSEAVETLKASGRTLISFSELEKMGAENPVEHSPPKPDDLACVMYTSGSTGNPKGVMITHKNMMSAVVGLAISFNISDKDSYLSYLPLAHILALTVSNVCVYFGVKIGFGNPRTLLDDAMKNCKGDVGEFRPTAFAAVPTVCDRIKKGISAKISKSSPAIQKIFNIAYAGKSFCMDHDLPVGLWDALVFKKMKAALGGRVRLMVSGGAPLSAECQRFLTVCFGVPILQGYGLTETCGAGTALREGDMSIGVVGGPLPCDEIKLVDAPELGYFTKNKPPQGEIWIRGPNVSKGYFKMPEKTAEDFKDGWFHTGDVGEWTEQGALKIIDRIKNLVKTPHGEYIALEKLESTFKNSKFVGNICVIVDPNVFGIVAVVDPPHNALGEWAKSNDKDPHDVEALCKNDKLRKEVLDDINRCGREAKLKSFELLAGIMLYPDPWTPENSFLTAAMKLNRNHVKKELTSEIKALQDKACKKA